ncbi:thermonuclease family protein [Thalassobaculum salexigens]|uniref:thermonuclease family protein n=1 Tax=Thalassobaculum salexigens TaxID=455360 RepID=UPI003CCB7E12
MLSGKSKQLAFASLLAISQLAASPGSAAEQSPPVIAGYGYAVDGDSLEIGQYAIRLFGVAAPEIKEPGGPAAKMALAHLIRGKRVRCQPTGAMSYHRHISTCWTADGDLAALMIGAGFARDCPGYSGGKYAAFEIPGSQRLPFPGYCTPRSR